MSQKVLPSFSEKTKSILVCSHYEHYKGNSYKIIGIARHTETLEELVVYQDLDGEGNIWVRPLDHFLETVVINGQVQPRFKLIE